MYDDISEVGRNNDVFVNLRGNKYHDVSEDSGNNDASYEATYVLKSDSSKWNVLCFFRIVLFGSQLVLVVA